MAPGIGGDTALAARGREGRVVRGAPPTPVRVPVTGVSMATASGALFAGGKRPTHQPTNSLTGPGTYVVLPTLAPGGVPVSEREKQTRTFGPRPRLVHVPSLTHLEDSVVLIL